jgi:5-methylcytosine-specific restriction endonuclease McrA
MAGRKICGQCGRFIDFNATCPCRTVKEKERNKAKNKQLDEENKFLKSKAWKELREKVLAHYQGYCQRCLIKYNTLTKTREVHHIKPRNKYNGKNGYPDLRLTKSNCVPVCKVCNGQLGTKGELDFPFETEKNNNGFVL